MWRERSGGWGKSVVALVHMTQYRKQIKPGPEGGIPFKVLSPVSYFSQPGPNFPPNSLYCP